MGFIMTNRGAGFGRVPSSEQPGSNLQIFADNIPPGGVDVGLFGFTLTFPVSTLTQTIIGASDVSLSLSTSNATIPIRVDLSNEEAPQANTAIMPTGTTIWFGHSNFVGATWLPGSVVSIFVVNDTFVNAVSGTITDASIYVTKS